MSNSMSPVETRRMDWLARNRVILERFKCLLGDFHFAAQPPIASEPGVSPADDIVWFHDPIGTPGSRPRFAILMLAPLHTVGEIDHAIDNCLTLGASFVWTIDPHFCYVIVYEAGHRVNLFNRGDCLTALPYLPDLCIPLTQVFE